MTAYISTRCGPFVGKGERTACLKLRNLNDNWMIIPNKLIPDFENKQRYEIDFIIIADRGIYCLEEKSWRGNYVIDQYGNILKTTKETSEWRCSYENVALKAKILAEDLRKNVNYVREYLGKSHFVYHGLLFSANKNELKIKSEKFVSPEECLYLEDVLDILPVVDKKKPDVFISDTAKIEILQRIEGFKDREFPAEIDNRYNNIQKLNSIGDIIICSAESYTKDDYSLYVSEVTYPFKYDDLIEKSEAGHFRYIHDILKHLKKRNKLLCPDFESPFLHEDKSLLILPIKNYSSDLWENLSVIEKLKIDDIVKVVKLFESAFSSLKALHSYGIIHCNLIPENIYINKEDHSVVFSNYVYSIIKKTDKTFLNPVVTPDNIYLSPEILENKGEIDEKSDVFTLGASIYNYITGIQHDYKYGYKNISATIFKNGETHIYGIDKIARSCLEYEKDARCSANRALRIIKEESKILEKKFFNIEYNFLFECRYEDACKSHVPEKENLFLKKYWNNKSYFGMEIPRFNPQPDMLGKEYKDIVLVGIRPAPPSSITKELHSNLINCIKKYSDNKYNYLYPNRFNDLMAEWFDQFKDNNIFFYLEQMGLRKEYIAFINMFKCRMPDIVYPLNNKEDIRECITHYFLPQIEILKPKLTIYFYDRMRVLLEELGYDPSFGKDNDSDFICTEPPPIHPGQQKYISIKEKVKKVLRNR